MRKVMIQLVVVYLISGRKKSSSSDSLDIGVRSNQSQGFCVPQFLLVLATNAKFDI